MPRPLSFARRIAFSGAGAVIAACGGSSAGNGSAASGNLSFHGESQALPTFSFDSGLQPALSPVQVQLVLSATGTLSASAQAVSGGAMQSPVVAGQPGSGEYTMDVRFGLKTRLKVDVSGVNFDGDVPGVESIEIVFGGSESFDPFLLDGSVSVEAAIPETELPPIPLQAILGVPGQLVFTIATGSVLHSEFRGTCAAVSSGEAHYTGETTTDGMLVVKPSVEIEVPVVGAQVFELPPISVPIPAATSPMDLGSQPVSGGGPAPAGSIANAGSCDVPGSGGSGGGGVGGSGASGGGSGSGGAAGGGEACPGATMCGEVCTQTAFDPQNCGFCGNVCPSGVCSGGACVGGSGGSGGKDGGADAGSAEICGNGVDDDADQSVDEQPCCQGSNAGCFQSSDCCTGLTCAGGICK
jgi:hypothetical protein